jgi:hypothetical protein
VTRYQFALAGLEASPYGFAVVVFHTVPFTHTMRVRLGAIDAQPLASELAGIQTVRSRLAGTIRILAERLDGTLSAVRLRRGTGNMVEAELVIVTPLDEITTPVTFGDAVAIALANKLPIYGDESLALLLQVAERTEGDEEIVLPSALESFLGSL